MISRRTLLSALALLGIGSAAAREPEMTHEGLMQKAASTGSDSFRVPTITARYWLTLDQYSDVVKRPGDMSRLSMGVPYRYTYLGTAEITDPKHRLLELAKRQELPDVGQKVWGPNKINRYLVTRIGPEEFKWQSVRVQASDIPLEWFNETSALNYEVKRLLREQNLA